MRWLPFVLVTTFSAASAHASEEFPDAVRDDLTLPKSPECSLCHVGRIQNYDSVRTPFGLAIRARGVGAEDGAALARALDLLASEGIDSDHDGIEDIVELQMGTDPNVAEGHRSVPVHFGCAVRGPRRSSDERAETIGWSAVAALSVWLVGGRRRSPS